MKDERGLELGRSEIVAGAATGLYVAPIIGRLVFLISASQVADAQGEVETELGGERQGIAVADSATVVQFALLAGAAPLEIVAVDGGIESQVVTAVEIRRGKTPPEPAAHLHLASEDMPAAVSALGRPPGTRDVGNEAPTVGELMLHTQVGHEQYVVDEVGAHMPR